jgi:urate oxidase
MNREYLRNDLLYLNYITSVIFDEKINSMHAVISHNNYGKSRVRVLKVRRDTPVHELKEMSLNILLEGDFVEVHTDGNNRNVLPTDTIKNTTYVLAREHSINTTEEFGLYLAKYFLDNNPQVSKVSIDIEEKLWQRIHVNDPSSNKPYSHDHSFVSSGNEKSTVKIVYNGNDNVLKSGISDLLVLKTTGSGFENYVRDKYTTLKETGDRVFSTSIKAEWSYVNRDVDYIEISDSIRRIILETFSTHNSLSVQHTLFEIGKNVIETIKDVNEIYLSMPNKHYLLFNLEQFGMKNKNEIFIPTDEPFGLIEATIIREE